jgi:hypothetical protein
MTLLEDLEAIVRDVVEEHYVDEDELRARVAEKIAAGLASRGLAPDPDIEAEAFRLLPVN